MLFFCGRALQYIVLRLYQKSRPWGIWHSKHTWVVAALGLAGAWITGNAWTFHTPAPVWNTLIFVGGIAFFIGAVAYYAVHEDEINE